MCLILPDVASKNSRCSLSSGLLAVEVRRGGSGVCEDRHCERRAGSSHWGVDGVVGVDMMSFTPVGFLWCLWGVQKY